MMQLVVIQLVAFLFIEADTVVDTVDGFYLLGIPLMIQLGFKELGLGEKIYPYRKARLADRGGDISKRWYVNYYIWDVQRNCLVRKQYYDLNEFNTESARRRAGNLAVKKINGMLEKGVHIDITKGEKVREFSTMTLIKAVRYGLELKEKKIARSSYLSYASPINNFIQYIEELGKDLLSVREWRKKDSIQYIDYLLTARKVSASTANKYRDYLKAVFTLLEEREVIEENVWKGITRERVVKTNSNLAFTRDERKIVLDRIKSSDTELLAFVQVMFFTFMRPTEIRQLRVKNVFVAERKIVVSAEISKNRIRGFVDVPEQLIAIIELLIRSKSPNEFLFQSDGGMPYGKNTMTSRHREILLELNLNEDHTLYSWKHTGVVEAYKNGVKIKSLQLQCRHHSIAQTDDYLKSLGLFENKEIKFGMPDLF